MRSLGRWLKESPFVRIVAGFALAALVLAALGWLVTGPHKGLIAGFDGSIRTAIRQMQSPMWTSLFLTVTKLGSTLYLAIIGSVVGLIFILLRWFLPLLIFIVVMTGQAALHHGFKWLIARPRPSSLISYREIESFSFPSGHAVASLCLYGTIAWIVASRIESPAVKAATAMVAVILIFLIGMSRVYIGIHYPTDVLAGFLAAAIWTAAVMSTDRKVL
ncbi:MAG: phosphatase PAP2 family protein [Blastocatellia bacterium]|nr:phosphatase PAP2 family protein [Blastocatellia bacterium]